MVLNLTSSFEILSLIAWIGCYLLLVYIYRKGLSETWYGHKLYWGLNLVTLLSCSIYGMTANVYSHYLLG